MSIESHADWKGLKAAAHVARLTLDALAKQIQPGVTTGELSTLKSHVAQLRDDVGELRALVERLYQELGVKR